MSKRGKIPDTNNPVNGQTPGEMAYHFMVAEDVCTSCRARWTDQDAVLCERCDAQRVAYYHKRQRRKLKRDLKRPSMVEVVVTRDTVNNTLQISIFSDVGTLLNIHRVDSIDIRDARQGKKHLRTFRAAA